MTRMYQNLLPGFCFALCLGVMGCGSDSPAPTDTVAVPDGGGQDTSTDASDNGPDASDSGPDTPPTPKNACLPVDQAPEFKISGRHHIRWKRVMSLEQDLTQALELTPEEACAEVGYAGVCFFLHIVALGGNEPVFATMYEPIAEPSATTALAVDRVAVAACGAAVDRDTTRSTPLVFKEFDLAQAEVSPKTAGISAMTTELYQRLLARDPTPSELSTVASLASPVEGVALSARDFAKMACYAIATTTEFIFH